MGGGDGWRRNFTPPSCELKNSTLVNFMLCISCYNENNVTITRHDLGAETQSGVWGLKGIGSQS